MPLSYHNMVKFYNTSNKKTLAISTRVIEGKIERTTWFSTIF